MKKYFFLVLLLFITNAHAETVIDGGVQDPLVQAMDKIQEEEVQLNRVVTTLKNIDLLMAKTADQAEHYEGQAQLYNSIVSKFNKLKASCEAQKAAYVAQNIEKSPSLRKQRKQDEALLRCYDRVDRREESLGDIESILTSLQAAIKNLQEDADISFEEAKTLEAERQVILESIAYWQSRIDAQNPSRQQLFVQENQPENQF